MLPAVHRGAAQQLPLTRRRPTCANRLCRRTSWARALRTSTPMCSTVRSWQSTASCTTGARLCACPDRGGGGADAADGFPWQRGPGPAGRVLLVGGSAPSRRQCWQSGQGGPDCRARGGHGMPMPCPPPLVALARHVCCLPACLPWHVCTCTALQRPSIPTNFRRRFSMPPPPPPQLADRGLAELRLPGLWQPRLALGHEQRQPRQLLHVSKGQGRSGKREERTSALLAGSAWRCYHVGRPPPPAASRFTASPRPFLNCPTRRPRLPPLQPRRD